MEPYLSLVFGGTSSGRRPGMLEIVAAISEQIRAGGGALAGCRLPPIRVLSHRLGVSKNTVSAAYDELRARALVESRGKRGLYVASAPAERAAPAPAARAPAPAFKAHDVPQSSPLQLDGDWLALGSVFIDPRLLPKERLAACFRSVLKRPGLSDGYDGAGYLPLRREIARRLKARSSASLTFTASSSATPSCRRPRWSAASTRSGASSASRWRSRRPAGRRSEAS